MKLAVDATPWNEAEGDWLIVGVASDSSFDGPLADLDSALGGALTRLKEAGDLTGELGTLLPLPDVPAIAAKRLLVVGLGLESDIDSARLDRAMTTAVRHTSEKKAKQIAVALPSLGDKLTRETAAQIIATAIEVGSVGQDLYQAEPVRRPFESATVLVGGDDDRGACTQAVERGGILGECINLTRELVNRPAGDVYPESFSDRADQLAREFGFQCEIFDEQRLQDERMNSMLSVAVGSDRPARMAVVEYRGAGDDAPTLGLIGKGVTFDSGGLSLKPNDSMKTMKCDMAGAATVLGAVTAIARLKLPVNVCGYMGLVENMVSGSSYKLGDVLTARNGTTIEVLNTDAEGRLVLADVLAYAVDAGVSRMIDLATLTGACVVALGEDVTGAFANDQDWCNSVIGAAHKTGENIWQMPMFDLYDELLKSDVADVKNVGPRWGGAITAAKFLQKFVGDVPWVHLDIAGPSFGESNKPHREGGGSGCMLRTLVETAAQFE